MDTVRGQPETQIPAVVMQTAAQLRERIQNTRQSASVRAPYRDFQIIPVTAADGSPAAEEDPRPLTRAVMVTVDPAVAYDENKESEWQTRVAQTEWQVLRTALTRPGNPVEPPRLQT